MIRQVRTSFFVALVLAALTGIAAPGAPAWEGPKHFDSDQYAIQWFETETSNTEAGAAVDFANAFEMKNATWEGPFGFETQIPFGRTRTFRVDLPPGLTGDPTAIPTCPRDAFLRFLPDEGCPPETQVGMATAEVVGVGKENLLDEPIYNLDPGPNNPAMFGIKFDPTLYAFIQVEVSSDGDLTAVIEDNPIISPVWFSETTMFGVPADHGAPGPRVAFMRNPTSCAEGFRTTLNGLSYEDKTDSESFTEPVRTECGEAPFEPSMEVTPSSSKAGAPTGLDVELEVPQTEDVEEPAAAHVKDVTMTLPEGMMVSASSATGLESCAPDQFGYHEETPITCPLASKVGTVEVETPILEEPLKGPVYVAKQNDNPFGSLLALYMAPAGSGVQLKLAGKVDLDPKTGRLTTTFLDNPQQPFSRLRVSLKDGPRAPLALPRSCGTYSAEATLKSWAMPGVEVPLQSSFPVDQGCGQENAFTPGFTAGTKSPTAGGFSPFVLRITRPDAQQNVSRFEATLPEGLLAKLAGVPLCPESDAAAASCPEASKVGQTTVGVGAGPEMVFAPEPGKTPTALYLAGPYNGGPYSIVAEVPAQAGPFDLGTVVVRNALRIDPRTARVTAVSDPLPQILQGIPISYRDIRVEVDRPGFTLNPTSCEPAAVSGSIAPVEGQAVPVSDRFQAAGCRALKFKPRLSLRLKGGTRRSDFPALTAVLRPRAGDANIDNVSVALPRSEFLGQAHIRTVCTRVQFAADACPKGAVYGRATAFSPLLDQPLAGPVYLRSSDNELPDLVADLRGPIDVELVGRIDSVRGGIRTTFDLVPDAPVSKFVLRMRGGQKGLLENSVNLCRATHRATVKMEAQNGRSQTTRPPLRSACGKGGRPSAP